MCGIKQLGGIFLGLFAATAWANPVGEVAALRGEASAIRQGQARALSVGAKIEAGTEIRTGAQGRAKIKFVDGSVVILSDGSSLKVDGFAMGEGGKRKEAKFSLDIGLISQNVAPSEGGSWSVRTPTVVTAVRGTEFIIEVKPDTATDVSIQSGEVSVNSLKKTRALPVFLKTPKAGTACNAEGVCSAAKEWKEDRLQNFQDRLSGL